MCLWPMWSNMDSLRENHEIPLVGVTLQTQAFKTDNLQHCSNYKTGLLLVYMWLILVFSSNMHCVS